MHSGPESAFFFFGPGRAPAPSLGLRETTVQRTYLYVVEGLGPLHRRLGVLALSLPKS